MSRPSPYQITAFAQAARMRSFSKAADVLGVTQSAVTQNVAKLENLMGVQLFVRRREGLELTNAGNELFMIADRILTLEELVAEKVGDYGDLSAGRLVVVANAPRPAMEILARYQRDFPKVEIEFTLISHARAEQRLKDRDIDIAIILDPEQDPSFRIDKIGKTSYRAYMRKGHPLASRQTISLRDLTDETVLVPEEGSLTQKLLRQAMQDQNIPYLRIMQMHTFLLVQEAVQHGLGIGFMLENGQSEAADICSMPIEELSQSFDICVVSPADKQDLRLVRSFRDVALGILA